MKRFLLITWALDSPTNFNFAKDTTGAVILFPRRKEAHEHAKEIRTEDGFNYRAVRINV